MPRRLIPGLLVLLALLAPPLAAPPARAVDAAATAAAEGKRRINLAGRQRMLSQRIAKAACFASIGLDAEGHLRMMGEARELFDATLRGLRQGNAEMGFGRETEGAVLAGLAKVGALWKPYDAAIRQALAQGAVGPAEIAEIARLNLPVLVEMNTTVTLTEQAYGSRAVPIGLAIAINISGRQRMLSQKMAKEMCLIAGGLDAQGNRRALGQTVALFEASLDALVNGAPDVGIRPPRGEALRATLAEVETLWRGLAPVYRAVAEGSAPDAAALATVSRENNRLLATMNEAVFLYEQE